MEWPIRRPGRYDAGLAYDRTNDVGSGWLSGLLGAVCGLVGLGAVLCLRFPEWLTVPEARALYPLPLGRAVLHVVLVGGFLLGALSLTLRRNKALGAVAVGATLMAALLGGSQVPVDGELRTGPFLGLDWSARGYLRQLLWPFRRGGWRGRRD